MRFVYDADSIYFAEQVKRALRHFGHFEAEAEISRVQALLESEVIRLVQEGKKLLDATDLEPAIRFLFFDPTSPDDVAPLGLQTLNVWRRDPEGNRAAITQVIRTALQIITDQDFRPSAPLNVLAALDVLFHLLILRRRNFSVASDIFRKTLGVQLQIVDEAGRTYYGDVEHERSTDDEQAFWNLFDTVAREWGLQGFRDSNVSPSTRFGVIEFISEQTRDVAFRLFRQWDEERTAA